MATSTEIKQRANALADKTDVNSITPKEVGGIMYDLASHSENVLRNGGTLGIRKVYGSVAAMEADSTNPKDFWGNPIKKGNLVVIYDGTTTGVDNNKIYAFMNPGWELATKLDAAYATKAETDAKLSELGFETKHIGNGLIDLCENDVYYSNYANVGEKLYLNKYTLSGWKSIIVKCKGGDRFKITGLGASTARLYSFVDVNNVVLSVAGYNQSLNEQVIIAPTNAYKVIYCTDAANYPQSNIVYYTDADIETKNEISSLSNDASKRYDTYLNRPFELNINGNVVELKIIDWIVTGGKPFYTGATPYVYSFDFSSISGGYAKVVYDLKTKTANVIPYDTITPNNNIVLLQFGLTSSDIRYCFANKIILNGKLISFDADFVNKLNDDILSINRKIAFPQDLISSFEMGVGYINYQSVGEKVDWGKLTDTSVKDFKSCILSCNEGDKFVITGAGETTARLWSIANNDGVVLSVASGYLNVENYTLEVPNGASKICICTNVVTQPNSKVVYFPHDSIFNEKNTSWNGKKCAFLGDSITYGEGTTKTYWQYLAERMGINATSYGVSGARMNFLFTNEIPNMLDSKVEYDAIFVFAGTNDFGFNTTMGEWFSETDDDTNINGSILTRKKRILNESNSFKGDLNKVLSILRNNFPNSKIILMTPIHRGKIYFSESNQMQGEDYANGLNLFLDDYVGAVRKAAEIWSCYLIDLYSETGLYPLNAEKYGQFFHNSNDLLHPNAKGHEVISKVIESHLKTIEL